MPIDLCRRITVRLSPEVYARLETVAGRTERTVSDVVRHAVEGLPVHPRRQSRAHEALIRQLIRVGNNLNQQTRILHLLKHRGDLPDAGVLLATLKEVKAVLRSVSRQARRTEA